MEIVVLLLKQENRGSISKDSPAEPPKDGKAASLSNPFINKIMVEAKLTHEYKT